VKVLIGLGGNVGDVMAAFVLARDRLAEAGRLVEFSRVYRTRPVGPQQSDYLNAALVVSISIGMRDLLQMCQATEVDAGRDRDAEQRWGPRPLDIDLLLTRGSVHRGPRLVVPHPRFHERPFALVPAADVASDWVHPLLGRTVTELAAETLERAPDAVELTTFNVERFPRRLDPSLGRG